MFVVKSLFFFNCHLFRYLHKSCLVSWQNLFIKHFKFVSVTVTVRELENDLGIPKTTVWGIFNKILGMTRVCAKFIPKLLTTEQKDLRSEITQDNLEMVSDD